jgi:hypothetical protein
MADAQTVNDLSGTVRTSVEQPYDNSQSGVYRLMVNLNYITAVDGDSDTANCTTLRTDRTPKVVQSVFLQASWM